ncbi:MAG: zinc-ribbon domain-containing protein [Treponema sp.]|nr:zinc-ribbon domain-containing protein [Treponema sp.]
MKKKIFFAIMNFFTVFSAFSQDWYDYDDYSYSDPFSKAMGLVIFAGIVFAIYFIISFITKLHLAKILSKDKGYPSTKYMWLTAFFGIVPLLLLCFVPKEKKDNNQCSITNCKNCGKPIYGLKKFCPFCGKTLMLFPFLYAYMSFLLRLFIFLVLFIFAMWYTMGKLTAFFAKQKNLDGKKWFWIGFFAGDISLFAVNCITSDSTNIENNTTENIINNKTTSKKSKTYICESCGRTISKEKKFCPYCGNPTEENA